MRNIFFSLSSLSFIDNFQMKEKKDRNNVCYKLPKYEKLNEMLVNVANQVHY